jgi:hypothetical protein
LNTDFEIICSEEKRENRIKKIEQTGERPGEKLQAHKHTWHVYISQIFHLCEKQLQGERFILAHSFRGFQPKVLDSVDSGPGVRESIMALECCTGNLPHGRQETRKEKGPGPGVTFKGAHPVTYSFQLGPTS